MRIPRRLPVSAKAILVTRDGKVLVMRKTSGLWDLPGGKVDDGEKIRKALKREVLEETGLKAKKFRYVASWVKAHPHVGDRYVIVYEADLKHNAKHYEVMLSEEHDSYEFMKPRAALKKKLAYGYKTAISMCDRRMGNV
ncbi:NUDIX domain-containing protein [Kordiimonas sediminis]|nr:NUDIX hydrolase [Kordiimonas sediminis]